MTNTIERPAWAKKHKGSPESLAWVEQIMDNIRAVIADRQLSLSDVERLTGIPEKRVRGLLDDTKDPYAGEVVAYCVGFDLELADLVPSSGGAK